MENDKIFDLEKHKNGKLVLSKPIDINGEKVRELTYDFEELTVFDKHQATKEFKKAGNFMGVEELDSDYHFYIFAAAVKKINDDIDTNDLMRMSAKDATKAEALVRDFFFLSSEE